MSSFLQGVFEFFADPVNWTGAEGIASRTTEHVLISMLAVAVACAIAIPPAVILGHTGRYGLAAVSLVNIGRAVPSFAIVALALPISIRLGLGLGFWPTLLALIALALPPVFTNTYTGIKNVAAATTEAGRGMGMSEAEVIRRIELPIASPVILESIRVASVQVIATATLGALVAWGGLGRYVVDGFAQRDNIEIFVGGLLVALLAIVTDLAFSALARWGIPRGLRKGRGVGEDPAAVIAGTR